LKSNIDISQKDRYKIKPEVVIDNEKFLLQFVLFQTHPTFQIWTVLQRAPEAVHRVALLTRLDEEGVENFLLAICTKVCRIVSTSTVIPNLDIQRPEET